MYDFFASILGWTLFGYILTLVGVYLTYVAVPTIVISGTIYYFCEK